MHIQPIGGALGAELTGIDLSDPTADEIATVIGALDRHLVVVVPDQDIDLDQLENVTDLLGGRDVTPFVNPLPDRPHVIRVIKEPGDELNFANAWHSDLSYLPEPPSYTLLHARDVPLSGGDTMFANQQRAFETLSDGLADTLLGLRATHSAGMAYGTGGFLDAVRDRSSMDIAPSQDAYRSQTHPMITRHPNSGKPALYVNAVYTTGIAGWRHEEASTILTHLYRHATNENFTFRVRWAPNTLTIWDNRAVQHIALNDYAGVRRELFRTSVKGAPPVPFTR